MVGWDQVHRRTGERIKLGAVKRSDGHCRGAPAHGAGAAARAARSSVLYRLCRLFHCFRLFQKSMKQTTHCFYAYYVSLFHCFAISGKCPKQLICLAAVGVEGAEASQFERTGPGCIQGPELPCSVVRGPAPSMQITPDRSIDIELLATTNIGLDDKIREGRNHQKTNARWHFPEIVKQ